MKIYPVVADAMTESFYWPHLIGAWFLWAMAFGLIGMGLAAIFWRGGRVKTVRLEIENERLRRDQRELRGRLEQAGRDTRRL